MFTERINQMKVKNLLYTFLLFTLIFCAGWSNETQKEWKRNDPGRGKTVISKVMPLAEERNIAFSLIEAPKIYTGGEFKVKVRWVMSKPNQGMVTIYVGDNSGVNASKAISNSGTHTLTFSEEQMTKAGLHTKRFRVLGNLRVCGEAETQDCRWINEVGNTQPKRTPGIRLENKNREYVGKDYVVTGKWKAEGNDSVELCYTDNGGSPVKFSNSQNHPVNQWYDYSATTIKASVRAPTKKHIIQVYVVDTETLKTNVDTVTLSPKVVKRPPILLLHNKIRTSEKEMDPNFNILDGQIIVTSDEKKIKFILRNESGSYQNLVNVRINISSNGKKYIKTLSNLQMAPWCEMDVEQKVDLDGKTAKMIEVSVEVNTKNEKQIFTDIRYLNSKNTKLNLIKKYPVNSDLFVLYYTVLSSLTLVIFCKKYFSSRK